MTNDAERLARAAMALREAFDRRFAEVPPAGATPFEDLLVIRVGDAPFVLRLAEIAGIHADRKVAVLPSRVPELVGICSLRGAFFSVYDLGSFLGYPPAKDARWIALGRGRATVALAFGRVEQHVRLPADALGRRGGRADARGYVRGVIELAHAAYPIIDVTSVIEAISTRHRPAQRSSEP